MRQIDADALKRKFRNVNEGMFQLSRVYEIIDNFPTVEFSKEICSACGRYIREKDGADMRGKEE